MELLFLQKALHQFMKFHFYFVFVIDFLTETGFIICFEFVMYITWNICKQFCEYLKVYFIILSSPHFFQFVYNGFVKFKYNYKKTNFKLTVFLQHLLLSDSISRIFFQNVYINTNFSAPPSLSVTIICDVGGKIFLTVVKRCESKLFPRTTSEYNGTVTRNKEKLTDQKRQHLTRAETCSVVDNKAKPKTGDQHD